jgi:predicted PurR-regulated permease PerM
MARRIPHVADGTLHVLEPSGAPQIAVGSPARAAWLANPATRSFYFRGVSTVGFVAALVTVLTLTVFLILGAKRYLNAGVELFAERHRPLVRSLLKQSAGTVTGYVGGNLAISVIYCVVTFIVLVVLGMPYAAALALLVAVLDLIPLVGATLGGRCSSSWVCSLHNGRPWCCSSVFEDCPVI